MFDFKSWNTNSTMYTFYLLTMSAIPNVMLKRWLFDDKGGKSYPFYSAGPCFHLKFFIIIDLQHEFIRDARSHERKIRIELKDFIDRMKKKKG